MTRRNPVVLDIPTRKEGIKMAKPDNATGTYECSACGESFDSQAELRKHEQNCIQKANPATATPQK